MASSLESLLAEGVISEIYGRLKSGKEAEVFAVAYGEEVVAAKVYKDRAQRSFKSNATYKEGRAVRNTRSQRAMDRGSKFGQEAAEDAWKAEEANALYKLHAAGVRVPKPVLFLEGVLFMELVRGTDGEVAPRLIDTQLDAAQAHAAYLDMLAQLVRILSCDLIHGDLSPYNVLWAESGATIIDFPQIVSAAQNSNSESFFIRDARNILGHFAAIDPSLRGRLNSDPREIWRAYVRRELTPDFLPTGRPPPPEARPRFEQAPRDRAPRDDRGPQQARASRDDRDPRPNRGPQPNHAQQNRGPQQSRGPQPNHAQPGRGPQLQMASAQANIASRNGDVSLGAQDDQRRAPQDGQRGPQDGQYRSQDGQRRAQDGQRGPQNGQRGPQNGQRGPQNGQRGPQNGQRGPQNGQRGPQNGQRRAQDGQRGPQNGQRRPQEAQRGPQNGQRAPQNGQRAPQNGQRRPQPRGPEVIVLTRRAPEGANSAERREPPAVSAPATVPHSDAAQDAARRRRR